MEKSRRDLMADRFTPGLPSGQRRDVYEWTSWSHSLPAALWRPPGLGSQRPSGGQCQCGLQRWDLPLSKATEMKRKEGRRGRTRKTHSRRPGAADLPRLQWDNYENKEFPRPLTEAEEDTHYIYHTDQHDSVAHRERSSSG